MLEKYREDVKFDGKFRQKIQNLLADNVSAVFYIKSCVVAAFV